MKCPKCQATVTEHTDEYGEHYKSMSNAQRVRAWMQALGQDTPETPGATTEEVVRLRESLIREEYVEASSDLDDLAWQIERAEALNTSLLADSAKELADLLVVTYGALVALGVDPDEVFAAVMDENEAKTEHAYDRGDGKFVVSQDVKGRIKDKTKSELSNLVKGGAS